MSPPASKYSERGKIAPFHVMEVSRRAREAEAAGADVIHLEVGQPSSAAPRAAIEAAHEALEADLLGYTDALGIPELRSSIAAWYQTTAGLDIPVANVVVTTGASGSCLLTFLALWDPGQRVGVLEPGYPCYRNDLETLGVEVVTIPVGADSDYRPTRSHLDRAGSLDGLIVASPSNPTGTILNKQDLAMVLGWAHENNVSVVVDEIYHGISYGLRTETVLGLLDETPKDQPPVVVLNSFSKYFSMTGWRLGWIIAPSDLIVTLERLSQNLTIAPPTLSQIAGIAALASTEECDVNVARYSRNQDILLEGLALAGLDKIAPPDGGFYIWCDVSHLVSVGAEEPASAPAPADSSGAPQRPFVDSIDLCNYWLDQFGVAVTPGIDFDLRRGRQFVRFSYSGSTNDMKEAMRRLCTWSEGSAGSEDSD